MDTLKILRKRKGVLQKEVAEYLGVSLAAYNHYESGRTQPDIETLRKLADYFDVTVDALVGRSNIPEFTNIYKLDKDDTNLKQNTVLIPILGRVLGGYDGIAEQEIMGYLEIEESIVKKYPGCFALKVRGKSMEPEIYDGDTVIVRPCSTVPSGSVAIICIGGDEGTIKRVKITKDGLTLIPTNNQYKPITYTPEQIDQLPIIINGQVMQVRHDYF